MSNRRQKIFEFNRRRAEDHEKAGDLLVIVHELGKLPPGQLKKVLTEEVIAVLNKYGVEV